MSAQTAFVDAASVDALFEPIRLGPLQLRNRVAMAPMSRYFCPDGIPHQANADYYRRRAEHGVGLIISEGTYIGHPTAASYAGVPFFWGAALDGWERTIDAVHAAGGRMFPQLWHTGSFRQSFMGPEIGIPGLGPSANLNAFTNHPEPTRAMTDTDIAEIIAAYADAAAAAQRLGFDGIEIHGAHGYLIDEFFWERTNRRTDRYGGSRRDRTRFGCEVIAAIRRNVGPDFPVSFRFSQWKQQDYTVRLADTPDELLEVLGPLVDAGASILHASTRRLWEPGFPELGELTLAGWVKKLTGVPVIAVGGAGLDRPGLKAAEPASLSILEAPLQRGDFDILAVGRALLADPRWLEKVREGRVAETVGYDKSHLDALV